MTALHNQHFHLIFLKLRVIYILKELIIHMVLVSKPQIRSITQVYQDGNVRKFPKTLNSYIELIIYINFFRSIEII